MKTVYAVQYDWRIEDGETDSELWLYENYKDAEQKFDAIIESEKDPELYFGQAFDEKGEFISDSDFELEQSTDENGNKSWYIYNNYGIAYSSVRLVKKEVL